MKITVDCGQNTGELNHFWHSTGFTPASLLLNADMRQNMVYAGSMPHGGITYVRIHYLLELVTGSGFGTDQVSYNWTALDTAMDVLVENGLIPIFELMGNPSGYFTDYTDDTQAHAWRDLVQSLAEHYFDRYGQDEVRRWYFETWNEPDVGWWKQSTEAFMVYYDACSEGLKAADSELRLGGPGSARTMSPIFLRFLEHCDTGTNYFTGETGVRLDFISVHEKGVRSSPEDLNPNSMGVTEREIEAIEHIRANHPRLADLPFMNNECDPQVGWKHFHSWRGRTYHAAIACKIINQHQVKIIDELGVNYVVLSNDNGFVGEWGNRTLLARFGDIEDVRAQSEYQSNESDLREDVRRRKFEALKKPVLNVMALLSLLGDQRCAVIGVGDVSEDVGAIASRRGDDQIAILLYNSADKIISCGTESIELQLNNLPFESAVLAHYRLDEDHGSPYEVWEGMDAPRIPWAGDFAKLREHQEPTLLEAPIEVQVTNDGLSLSFDMPLPSVSLVLLSARTHTGPDAVTNLRLERYDGLADIGQVMVIWDGSNSRVVQTYEVLFSDQETGPFERVNPVDTICTAVLHVPDRTISEGYYKVRTVDYWGRSVDSDVTHLR